MVSFKTATKASPPSDQEVVARHLEGDELAFPEIVRRYRERLTFFIYRRVEDEDRTEDLVQETFIRAFRHAHNFNREKKFSTWIFTIAINLTRNELRNRSRRQRIFSQRFDEDRGDGRVRPWSADETFRPDHLFRKRELRNKVAVAVAQLPEHHRTVFELRELEGKTYEEISATTGIRLGTVKSRLNRARDSFAQIIAPMLD